MFDKNYLMGLSSAALDELDTDDVREILVARGFITGYNQQVVGSDIVLLPDGGFATTTELVLALRPAQNQKVRAWLTQWRTVGPGTVEVIGGDDGTQYSQPEE